jgi:hypothetical protein
MISPGGKVTKVVALATWLDRDLKDSADYGESVGLIVEDEFFNRRGEVISLPDNPPKVVDRFKASIFWLGQKPLKLNQRYKLKLATSESEAQISEILNLIDSSQLAPIPSKDEVKLNEVAEVEISLKKDLPIDLFSDHQATGRFVLVDGFDVSGGGIVTMAYPKADIRLGFIYGNIKARCEVFEEYYYNLGDLMINKAERLRLNYTVGDAVPLNGLSYRYPENFDIVIFRDKVTVQIRSGRVESLVPFSEYTYQGLPLANGRGFGVLVNSPEEWHKAKADFEAVTPESEPKIAKRWLDFNTFRRIPIGWGDMAI